MSKPKGGAWGQATVEWLNWHLKGDVAKKAQFTTKGGMPGYTQHEFKGF
jgi:hypothetical protein